MDPLPAMLQKLPFTLIESMASYKYNWEDSVLLYIQSIPKRREENAAGAEKSNRFLEDDPPSGNRNRNDIVRENAGRALGETRTTV
jgi:hypothetical protein